MQAVRFREMRGLKEHAKERSLARGTSGGRRSGRTVPDRSKMPSPTRAQWAGLTWVMQRAEDGRRSLVAGGKRSAATMERKGWIRWFYDPHPDSRAKRSGWEITDAGREAYWAGQRKYGMPDSDLVIEEPAGNACRRCGSAIAEGRTLCGSLECGLGELP